MSESDSTAFTTPDQLAELGEKLTAAQSEQVPAVVESFYEKNGTQPPFDHLHDFWFNFAAGPRDGLPVMRADAPVMPTKLLDFKLNFPFGVPACALTPHARYIEYFARRGFDLMTYKTVRDRPWNPHPFPQWAFVPDVTDPLSTDDIEHQHVRRHVFATLDPLQISDLARASLVNSFGVPSLSVEQWKADIADAKAVLAPGQVLIVSVMGSPDADDTRDDADLIRQFVRTAAHAAEAGADIVELNLSCPNTGGDLICSHATLSADVARAVRSELKKWDVPVFIKIGYLDPPALRELTEACQPHIQGVVAINTVSVKTSGRDGNAFFPSYLRTGGRSVERSSAGLSGTAIRDLGLRSVRLLADIRETHRADSDWSIIGVGGVMAPADFVAYRDAGADAVQSCSGAWLNPRLAIETREVVGRAPSGDARTGESSTFTTVVAKVGELLAAGGLSTRTRE
jgi:dihydroorotate dehydrogenase (NAD+) catalytic subunit